MTGQQECLINSSERLPDNGLEEFEVIIHRCSRCDRGMGAGNFQKNHTIPEQSLNIPRTMPNMQYLDSLGNGAVKHEVIVETGNVPGADILQAGAVKLPEPAGTRLAGERGKGLVGQLDRAGGRIGIDGGDPCPNRSQLRFDTW